MYFEGPEKKLEIYSFQVDFLSYSNQFWQKLVATCGAEILSEYSTDQCKAYLLSESSLFVWKHKILMITCGRTELIKSAELMVSHLGLAQIDHFFFERKNEYFPEYQKSFVLEDFKILKNIFPEGYGLRFGDKDDHHLNLFEYSRKTEVPDREKNLEVLMYGVEPSLSDKFLNPTSENKKVLSQIIYDFFPGYKIDEHWFEPYGYSMNALHGDSYGTIHVTPEKDQNYISFELNNIEPKDVSVFINKVFKGFQPRSIDVIYFNPEVSDPLVINIDSLLVRQKRFDKLRSGYGVSYYHWSETNVKPSSAEEMAL